MDRKLDTDTSLRSTLEDSIEDGLSDEDTFDSIVTFVKFAYMVDSGYDSNNDTICSVDYDSYSACGGDDCVKYRIKSPL